MLGLSNWREEFNLSEVVTGKMTDKEALKTVTEKDSIKTVSYTHLTLPTKRIV